MMVDQEIMAATQIQMNQDHRNGAGIDNQGRG